MAANTSADTVCGVISIQIPSSILLHKKNCAAGNSTGEREQWYLLQLQVINKGRDSED